MAEVERVTDIVGAEARAEAEEKAESDIDEHEIAEVDKNGDSSAPAVESAPQEETEDEKKNRACRQSEQSLLRSPKLLIGQC